MKKLWAILGCSVLILSNALAVRATPDSAIENVTIEDVSSEYTRFGSDRTAGNTIDGSGLATDADGKLYHSNNPEDMWLSSKDRQAGITFDVENYYDLSRVHVWSYNEGNRERNRVKGVEILVASEPDPAYNSAKKFESLGTFTLPSAPGTNRYYGKAIDLNDFGAADNVRLVQFRFPDRGGLSEVKFYGSPLPGGESRRKQARQRREEYMKRKKTGTMTEEERFAAYNERRMQTLEKMAGDGSLWGAIARLYLGKEVEKANQIIMKKDLGHWTNHIRQLALYEMFNATTGHRAKAMSRGATDKLNRHMWECFQPTLADSPYDRCRHFHFLPEEPWWYWGNQNHGFIYQSWFYTAAHALKDIPKYAKKFDPATHVVLGQGVKSYDNRPELSGITLADYAERGRRMWRNRFRWMAAQGLWAEDKIYRCYDIASTYNLAYHASDPAIRKRARMILDVHWLIYAMHMVDEQLGGAMNRFKPHYAGTHADRGLGWYYFGGRPANLHATHVALLGDYRPPKIAYRLMAREAKHGCFVYRERLTTFSPESGQPPHTYKYSYVTPEYVLGSYILHNLKYGGLHRYSEREFNGITFGKARAMLRLGPAVSFHGYHCMQNGPVLLARWYGAELARQSDSPYAHPNPDLRPYISIIRRESGGAEIEPASLQQGWLFGRAGDAYYAIRPAEGSCKFREPDGDVQGELQRFGLPSPKIPFIVHAGGATEDGSFGDFKEKILDNTLTYNNNVLTYEDDKWGTMQFAPYADEPAGQWRRIDGEPVELPDKLFDSPYLNSDYGSGVIMAQFNDRKLILDFNKNTEKTQP